MGLLGCMSPSTPTGSCPGWTSELLGKPKKNPRERQQSRLLPLPPRYRDPSLSWVTTSVRPAALACGRAGSKSHLIPLRSGFCARKARRPDARWSTVGQGRVPASPNPHPHSQEVGDRGQTDRQTDTDVPARLMGGVREGVEPPGRGGAIERSSASRPLQRLGLVGDTKSSRSVPSAWRRVSDPGL